MFTFNRRKLLAGIGAALGLAKASTVAQAQSAKPESAQNLVAGDKANVAEALRYPFAVPPLPYAYTANEPSIDQLTMQLHHDKHHAAYVTNLNKALEAYPDLQRLPLHEMLAGIANVPEAIRTVVRNNGGGHANHSMFWQVMGGKGGEPDGEVGAAITKAFGSYAALKAKVNATGAATFGSGWAMVVMDRAGALQVVSRPNQDSPLMDGARVIFGNDVWEHAYYLKYQNRRPDYLQAWWNVLDWARINERYAAAKRGTLTI